MCGSGLTLISIVGGGALPVTGDMVVCHTLCGDVFEVDALEPDSVFQCACRLFPDKIAKVAQFALDRCDIIFVSKRIAPTRGYGKLLVVLRQCRSDFSVISSRAHDELYAHLLLASTDVFAACRAYGPALELWHCCCDSSMRTIGMLSNVILRLEVCILLHLGSGNWAHVRHVMSGSVSVCLLSLQRRHSFLLSLACSTVSEQERYFVMVWGSLTARELDDLLTALRVLDFS